MPAIDSGTVTPAAMVGTMRRMNSSTTSSTSPTVSSSVYCTSSTLARIVPVRSDKMVSLISGGIQDFSSGNTAFTLSTVSITLAPADLVSVSNIAGCWPNQAASRALATPSITVATSDRRNMAPLTFLITSGRYCAAFEICPFTPMDSARSGPWNPPVASVTLAPRMTV